MEYNDDKTFTEMCFSINVFLSSLGVMQRMTVAPCLVLNIPTLRMMHDIQVEIIRNLPTYMTNVEWSYPDDCSIKFTPMAGVSIVLTTTERLAGHAGKPIPSEQIEFTRAQAEKDIAASLRSIQRKP